MVSSRGIKVQETTSVTKWGQEAGDEIANLIQLNIM